ncbi:MAG: trypsin-like peptidase domain-containing protein [Prochloraceae cyanobacterium]|nr:trypsin-like peptidase domain-containing protein [Prochloraceae cyanobacterium]
MKPIDLICPGKEARIKSQDVKPEVFRRLVLRRARQLMKPEQCYIENRQERKKLEAAYLEKVNLKANFLPAKFLEDGANVAKAVCRILTFTNNGTGSGTGFLIAPGVLMTNNHVLSNLEEAQSSVAEFDYELGKSVRRIALEAERLFITNVELDFTIVGCASRGIEEIPIIPLSRNPALITRNDLVNIIQHPRGRLKEVALQENKTTRVLDKIIHYRTDTEPGSSGSPVFNNSWELVALHHAGWKEEDGTATNEGIRISAIVAYLIAQSTDSPDEARRLNPILEHIVGTSPWLGFFDIAGVSHNPLEIQVDSFQGDRDFADIGFWNIENFNNGVRDSRIQEVAEVVNRLSLDVLGLSEIQSGALDRLVNELANFGDAVNFKHLDVAGGQDLAVLYDTDTTTVQLRDDLNNRYHNLLRSRTSDNKTAFPREPLFAECQVTEGNQQQVKFMMIVVHLKAFGDEQSRARRKLAAQKLVEIINDIRTREELPVVLGGDYNEELNTDTFLPLQDAPDLFALTADDAADSNAATFIGRRFRSVIDNIIVSQDLTLGEISGDDAAIVRLDRSVRDFADEISDHVPVVFRAIFRGESISVPEPNVTTNGNEVSIAIPQDVKNLRLVFENNKS